MKTYSKIYASSIIAGCVAFTMLITSCQKDEDAAAPMSTTSYTSGSTETSAERNSFPTNLPALLEVPAGNEIVYHTYATGFQIYTCTETAPGVYAWVFTAPQAALYANYGNNGSNVGTHYAGPTWESNSGSKVVGIKLQGVTVNATAIPWLKLGVVSTQGPGIFEDVTFIQRVNTVGGLAPATGANANTVGQQAAIPYTAEYFFYKVQ